jgi:hypothetical protein
MTIDERLEALTRNLELAAQLQQQTERELRRFIRLARAILTDHEERLQDLEPPEDLPKGAES